MPWTGPTSGLIHRWPLDSANLSGGIDSDVVGSINITEAGGVINATGPTGLANTARSFDGTTGTGTFASPPLPNTGAYTVSAWGMTPDITANVGTGAAQTILDLGTNSTNRLRLVVDNGAIAGGAPGEVAWSTPQTTQQRTSAAVFANNQYTQVGVTFDGASTWQTVINGVVISTVSSVLSVPAAFEVIASRDGSAGFFFGPLAQLAIYNRVLSSSELTQLYNADAPIPTALLNQQTLLFV